MTGVEDKKTEIIFISVGVVGEPASLFTENVHPYLPISGWLLYIAVLQSSKFVRKKRKFDPLFDPLFTQSCFI